jgi:ribonuclease J
MLGVDYVIPDFSYIFDNREKLRGIVITHGHEDHIGALPFLLKEINVPVYGTALTLGLVRNKLLEHDLEDRMLIPVKPRDVVTLGVFSIEFVRVTHSIVDGVGLGIQTPVGLVVHTGDFKLDPTPVDGQLLDLHKFTEYGEKGRFSSSLTVRMQREEGLRFLKKRSRGYSRIYSRMHQEELSLLPLHQISIGFSRRLMLR